jgi:CO/xanthine dehydrogenase FAD-binding subunit
VSYLSPESVADACAIKAELGAKVIAGCTDFFPASKAGDAAETLLDITRIDAFRSIKKVQGGWRIGALVTWTEISRAALPTAFLGLQLAAREVGSLQIQNRGTVGGNICNASPAADGVPPLLALDAEVEIVSRSGSRMVKLAEFITGVRAIDLGDDELVSAFFLPDCPENTGSSFLKLGSRTHLVISIAMVSAVTTLRDRRIQEARVAVGSCSPVATRLPDLESRLVGLSMAEVEDMPITAMDCLGQLSPISDVRGTAAYRLDVVAEMCRRAVVNSCMGI